MNIINHADGCGRGLGRVELAIAVAIGLFALFGLSMTFPAVEHPGAAQERLAQLQDEARSTFAVLTRAVESAGYFPDPTVHTVASAFPAAAAGALNIPPAFGAGQTLAGTAETATLGATGDVLSVRYVADGKHVRDCRGDTPAANTLVTDTFFVSALNELMCAASGQPLSSTLAQNVNSMTVAYGIDPASAVHADRYLDAAAVTQSGLWTEVQSVRITLDLANPLAGQSGQPATVTWIQVINIMGRRTS